MVGEGKGLGRNVNIGWPSPGMKDADYLHAFTELILPIAYEYDPDIVFIAAGYGWLCSSFLNTSCEFRSDISFTRFSSIQTPRRAIRSEAASSRQPPTAK